MGFIGDIERLLALLWPFRVPLAIGLLIAIVLLLYVAYRRGWHRAAARHPRSTLVAVVIILAVGLPTAWVLGSPLLIRTELTEEPPVVAAGTDAGILLQGEFVGADDFHFGSGTATLVETAPGGFLLTLDEFSVQNGPDLFVYLSPDPGGWTSDAVLLGPLKATDGSFSYEIPADLDPATVGSAVIWCRAFSVLFAIASLGPPAT